MNASTRPAAPRARLALREDRLAALLDAAAAEFNLYGVAGARLSRIARAVGLTRAALYYYFASREDLAFHCYRRECALLAGDLDAAQAAGGSGLERLRRFVLRTLDPARPAGAVLAEVACLEDAQRAAIEEALAQIVRRLRSFLDEGAADGSARRCDSEVAAQAVLGMVLWAPLAEEWAAGTGAEVRRHAAHAIADLVVNGVAADPAAPLECPLDIASFAFRPGNAFDREAAAAAKVELLTRTASKLFNRRGIDGTSLDEITRELGATKGAFYQYIPDKTALVVECHHRQLRLSADIAEAAGRAGRSGMQRGMFGLHLLVQAFASELAPLAPLTGVETLPAKARAQIRRRGQALARRYQQFISEGLADGSYRPFEARTLATVGAGVFSWIPRWRTDDDPRPPRVIADEVVAIFVRGLRRRP